MPAQPRPLLPPPLVERRQLVRAVRAQPRLPLAQHRLLARLRRVARMVPLALLPVLPLARVGRPDVDAAALVRQRALHALATFAVRALDALAPTLVARAVRVRVRLA